MSDDGLTEATQRVRDLIRDPMRATDVEAVVRAAREDVADRIQQARADALDEAADDMDDTDDPHAIYVDNGDIDLWLRARAAAIRDGEA